MHWYCRVGFATLALLFSNPATGQQSTTPVSFSPRDRERLYEELWRDVAAMDRELGIYKRVVALASPSVVHIESTPLESFRLGRDIEEAGSGVIVREGLRHFVLTNRHVVRHSDVDHIRIEIADGRQIKPLRVVDDPKTDVAVLFIDADDLIAARVGDSDEVEIGDIVLAFGSPFNLRYSVTRGIISGKGRANLDLADGGVEYQNFLQTDAAINPGNSGGPLVNLRGEVVGLNTAIASNSGGNDGIGFSIPINIAMSIARQLIDRGRIDFGFLGVSLDADFDARKASGLGLSRVAGAHVTGVTPNSPAANAGLAVDDVILRFNNTPIENDQHFISLVKLTTVGRQIELVVLRQRQLMTLVAQVGSADEFPAEAAPRR
ncbi:MAG TPA: trypsin-like peptidase domain-containing protein [Lacipirellulaceae bacterium]|nr:trypsin-like peptidase domain-containing protein [Lacipirellulaceae bacterium]HMP04709.1 trypsin-like peptidase domain-containing protein [Lacipirellulaceae bacterium]